MIDTHCHVDLYPNPSAVATEADRAGILTLIVTNLPSAFDRAFPYVQGMKNIRLALGLHPLAALQHQAEIRRFRELIDHTSYIGEIGLDFSSAGIQTKEVQIASFRNVLRAISGKPKFITLHSRQAEGAVLDILSEETRTPVVFHWYSGPLRNLVRAVDDGHYFSVNTSMIQTSNGKKIVEALPRDRILTESDGPFVQVRSRPARPQDVRLVEEYLAGLWKETREEVSTVIRQNFLSLIRPLQQQIKDLKE